MNNRGQTLVAFVLIVPVLFLIFMVVYNIGNMVLLKDELNDINHIVINYGLKHIEEENVIDKMKELAKKNKNDIDNISINIDNNKIYVILEDSIDTKMNLGLFRVKSDYVGYIDNDKKIIERNN